MSGDEKDIIKHLTIDDDGTIRPRWDLRAIFDDIFEIKATRPTYRDYEMACTRSGTDAMSESEWKRLFGEP